MTNRELGRLIRLAGVRIGWFLPRTAEEVRVAEEAQEVDPVELPKHMKEPPWHLLDEAIAKADGEPDVND